MIIYAKKEVLKSEKLIMHPNTKRNKSFLNKKR